MINNDLAIIVTLSIQEHRTSLSNIKRGSVTHCTVYLALGQLLNTYIHNAFIRKCSR